MSKPKDDWAQVEVTVTGKRQKDVIDTSKRLADLVEKLGGRVETTGVTISDHIERITDVCALPSAKVESFMRKAPEAADIRGDDIQYQAKRLTPKGKHL